MNHDDALVYAERIYLRTFVGVDFEANDPEHDKYAAMSTKLFRAWVIREIVTALMEPLL